MKSCKLPLRESPALKESGLTMISNGGGRVCGAVSLCPGTMDWQMSPLLGAPSGNEWTTVVVQTMSDVAKHNSIMLEAPYRSKPIHKLDLHTYQSVLKSPWIYFIMGWRHSWVVTFMAIRLRGPGFKPRPENKNFCFRRTPAVVKACHRAGWGQLRRRYIKPEYLSYPRFY